MRKRQRFQGLATINVWVSMALGKYQQWLEPDKLEEITNWAAHGLTDAEIASNLGITTTTYYRWMNTHSAICDAIKNGRMMRDICVENALFRLAIGGTEETTEVIEEKTIWTKAGEEKLIERWTRTTRRKIPPQLGATIFFLKNRMGYRDNPADSENGAQAKVNITFGRELWKK